MTREIFAGRASRLAEQLHLNVLAESLGNRVPQRIFEHPVHQHGNIRAEVAAAVFTLILSIAPFHVIFNAQSTLYGGLFSRKKP